MLERTAKVIGNIKATYDDLLDGPLNGSRHLFAGVPSQEDKDGWPQLQAADVLAWEMSMDLKWTWNPERRFERGSCKALMEHCDRMQGTLLFLPVGYLDDRLWYEQE